MSNKEELGTEEKLKSILDFALKAQGVISQKDAEALIAATVASTLLQIGIDPKNLIETQKDAAFIRKWRLNYEKIEQVSWRTMIVTILTGAFALMVMGFKDWWPSFMSK